VNVIVTVGNVSYNRTLEEDLTSINDTTTLEMDFARQSIPIQLVAIEIAVVMLTHGCFPIIREIVLTILNQQSKQIARTHRSCEDLRKNENRISYVLIYELWNGTWKRWQQR